MIEAVLFDLGGVLCTFDAGRRTDAIAAASGASPDAVHHALASALPRLDKGTMDEAALLDHIHRKLGWRCSSEELCDAWSAAFAPRVECIGLARRVVVGRGILTNNGPPLSTRFARALPSLVGVFDAVVFSADIGHGKPSPRAFEAACGQLGTAGDRTLFVDDTPSHVEAARALGLDGVLFRSVEELANELTRRSLLGAARE